MVRKLFVFTVLFAFLAGFCQLHAREKDFGKKWVRSHPFTTMGLCLVEKAFEGEAYRDDNFSQLLAWKWKKGIMQQANDLGLEWHGHVRPHRDGLTEQLKTKIQNVHSSYRGCTGWVVWDEPKRPEMFTAAPTLQWLREQYPELLVYSNAYPRGVNLDRAYGEPNRPADWDYRDYLRSFIDIMGSDILMFDLYPFRESGSTSNFFPCLEDTRAVAAEYDVPYWAFIQSHSDKRRGYRMPSESDLRMQAFAHLTYGFTGIAYFTYDDAVGPGIVDMHAKPRPIYYDVQRLNLEIGNVGQALRFLTSTDIRYLAVNGNSVPGETTAWSPDAGGGLIREISVADKEGAKWKDLLVGYFKDDAGKDYFMITNLWHGMGVSAAERKVSVAIKFKKRMKSISRLSRETGQVEELRLENNTLKITLPGGTGELFKVGRGAFVGLNK